MPSGFNEGSYEKNPILWRRMNEKIPIAHSSTVGDSRLLAVGGML